MDEAPEPLSRQERREERRREKESEKKSHATKRALRRVFNWSIVFALIAASVYGMFTLATSGGGSGALREPITANDHIKGKTDSQIVLVEYADFQCPACKAYFGILKTVEKEYGDRVAFVYRHFPLTQHLNADTAAQAAEAAGKQGKFWEMHDKLFESQDMWASLSAKEAENVFNGYAAGLGLDAVRFKADIISDEITERIDNDFKSGLQSGVNGTPTFFLQGIKVQNSQTYDEFKQLLDGALGEPSQ